MREDQLYVLYDKKNKKKTELLSVGRAEDFREEDRDIHCGKHLNRNYLAEG